MGAEAMRAATVYRRLLKAADKHVGKDGSKGHFRDFVSQEFRNNSNLSEQEAARRKLKLASDYTYLINSVHHHQELLFSYNIAVDRSDEMKKILNKSAASVGLQLPDEQHASPSVYFNLNDSGVVSHQRIVIVKSKFVGKAELTGNTMPHLNAAAPNASM
ncbi:hypothetical protein LUZ62_019869 [Rhynchospora pubera]|uniref:Mitochondrial zinc maintenance protein 1, mitochondrial n=1 Tax=Rhynchospora pubera TaxID=906938 RepID=A0AAV8GWV5_9POAL|nr:hypothetical protein LUZ62_019869 [Rhynchospora pubera]